MQNLTNKVVLVTGASSGLGEQICYQAAKQGAIIIACARSVDKLQQVKERCEELSQNHCYAFKVDMSDAQSIEYLVQAIYANEKNIDVLVNCAGFGYFEDFIDFDMNQARQMFEVNILGMMLLTQKIAAKMVLRQSGHIINIASMAGKMATPKSTIYSATKFAVIGFSNALRLELKPFGIHVTTVNPGPIETNFFNIADPNGGYLDKIGAMVLQADDLAKEIVNTFGKNKSEINRPRLMNTAAFFYQVFPTIGDYLAGGIFNKK